MIISKKFKFKFKTFDNLLSCLYKTGILIKKKKKFNLSLEICLYYMFFEPVFLTIYQTRNLNFLTSAKIIFHLCAFHIHFNIPNISQLLSCCWTSIFERRNEHFALSCCYLMCFLSRKMSKCRTKYHSKK